MLGNCKPSEFTFDNRTSQHLPYAVTDPEIEILDDMSAKLTATFNGPPDSLVIGRAWISDADGTMVDAKTDEISAGTRAELHLTIPTVKVQNGNLIACMRVEWPNLQTKHVVQWTLLEGDIVHPPKGTSC